MKGHKFIKRKYIFIYLFITLNHFVFILVFTRISFIQTFSHEKHDLLLFLLLIRNARMVSVEKALNFYLQ